MIIKGFRAQPLGKPIRMRMVDSLFELRLVAISVTCMGVYMDNTSGIIMHTFGIIANLKNNFQPDSCLIYGSST